MSETKKGETETENTRLFVFGLGERILGFVLSLARAVNIYVLYMYVQHRYYGVEKAMNTHKTLQEFKTHKNKQ